MKNELKRIAVKSMKLAGVTCVAAGAIALVASGAAIKAVTAGGKYLKEAVQKILSEDSETEAVVEEKAEELTCAEGASEDGLEAEVEGEAETAQKETAEAAE